MTSTPKRLQSVKNFIVPGLTIGLILGSVFLPNFKRLYFPKLGYLPHIGSNHLIWTYIVLFIIPIISGIGIYLWMQHYLQKDRSNYVKISFIQQWIIGQRGLIIILFPITIFMEELFFRGYLYYFLADLFQSPLQFGVVNAAIFGIYHIHIWFSSHDWKLTGIFMIASGALGFWLGFFFECFGIFTCWIIHLGWVSIIYCSLLATMDLKG